jgi:DNA replication and repair protein RecF
VIRDEGGNVSGIAVTSLSLSHFRSHRTTRLALSGGPVVIVGPNGAGKTSILEAVSLLSPGRGLRQAATEDIVRRPEGPGWKVAAKVTAPGEVHEVETWAETGAVRQVRIDGKPAPQGALGRIARVLWLVPAMDRLWIEAAEGRRRFLDRLTLSFRPDHADRALAYDRAMRERNRLLRDQVADDAWFGALEVQMATAAAAILANRTAALARIAQAQDGAQTAFPRADLAETYPEDPPPRDAEALILALAAGRRRDMAAGRTLVGPHRADLAATYAPRNLPAAQCSTGEQKALLVSLILANARALAEDLGAAPILLLDEIAAHLDETRRQALFAEIAALDAQALLTGTGPELFPGIRDRAQILEVVEADGLSLVRGTVA